MSEDVCAFCLDTLPKDGAEDEEGRVRGTLVSLPGHNASCSHAFHFVCAVKWAQRSSRCPVCRADYDGVKNARGGDVVEVDKANTLEGAGYAGTDEDGGDMLPLFTEEDAHAVCFHCGLGDREDVLLLCDSFCGRACHVDCAGLTGVPEGDWHCPACANGGPSASSSSLRVPNAPAARTVERAREQGAADAPSSQSRIQRQTQNRSQSEIDESWLWMKLCQRTQDSPQAQATKEKCARVCEPCSYMRGQR